MGDYTPWADLLDSLEPGLQKKQTKKQKLKIPFSASSSTCPLGECNHASLLGEEIWIGQQHQPCPFQVQEEPMSGCSVAVGRKWDWQGRLRMSPHSKCKCFCLQPLLRARQHLQEL